jgi:aspartate/methionine/tyrosine aminotransferase
VAFGVRTGADIRTAPAYRDGRYNCDAIAEALDDLPDGEPAAAVLNLPSNPGGYSATLPERDAIVDSLAGVADRRPLVVLCDDAYAGLVFEPDVPRDSMFWDLIGRHDNLIPVKVDGATKEFCIFGGRVGFITFPFEPDSRVTAALESKAKCVARATVSTPVAPSQVLLLQALRSGTAAQQVEAVRLELEDRYKALKDALAAVDASLLRPQPFNSGCFALVELAPELNLDPEEIRQSLLNDYDTGVIAIRPNYLRIAHCSIAADAIPELIVRVEAAVRSAAGG